MNRVTMLFLLVAFPQVASAAERFDPMTRELIWPDLEYTASPRAVGEDWRPELFHPEGDGPFPALVMMPTCDGNIPKLWIEAAVADGYAVMAMDTLAPRKVRNNCHSPLPVPQSRLLKDAVDAGHFLETLPVIDKTHIGLMGYSQGGQLTQALTGAPYKDKNEPLPFAAMVGVSMVCRVENDSVAQRPYPVDIQYMPEKVVIPLMVEIGEKDETMCEEMAKKQIVRGAPVEYHVYKDAPHMWMQHAGSYRQQSQDALRDMLEFLDRSFERSH